MKNIIILSLLTLIVIGILGYALLRKNSASATSTSTSTTQIETAPLTASEPMIVPSSAPNELLAGGSSYGDPQGVFSFLYPNEYKLDSQNSGQYIRISKIGPTQKGQTEMYDGVIVVFESVNLQGKTLEQWVDAHIAESTADGTSRITQPKDRFALKSYSGFTYKLRGLGESTNVVIQKSPDSKFAVNISYSVYDPKEVGFQKEVDNVLGTLEVLK